MLNFVDVVLLLMLWLLFMIMILLMVLVIFGLIVSAAVMLLSGLIGMSVICDVVVRSVLIRYSIVLVLCLLDVGFGSGSLVLCMFCLELCS